MIRICRLPPVYAGQEGVCSKEKHFCNVAKFCLNEEHNAQFSEKTEKGREKDEIILKGIR